MKASYFLLSILNSLVLFILQDGAGGHFTIGKMEKRLTPIGWAVLILLAVFAFWLFIKGVVFLLKSKKLK